MQLSTVRVPVDSSYVFRSGFLLMSIEAATDFDLRGKVDDAQARDKDTGLRMWNLSGIDMDLMYQPGEEPAGFRRTAEVKVRIMSAQRPLPPAAQVQGFGPVVEFVELTLTPYADTNKCTGPRDGRPHICKARLAYSLRATGIREFSGLVSTPA